MLAGNAVVEEIRNLGKQIGSARSFVDSKSIVIGADSKETTSDAFALTALVKHREI